MPGGLKGKTANTGDFDLGTGGGTLGEAAGCLADCAGRGGALIF